MKSLRLFFSSLCIIAYTAMPLLSQAIPQEIAGKYEGDLYIKTSAGVSDTVTMALEIGKGRQGAFDWTIIYGTDGKDVRKYILKAVDTLKGTYVMDELNSIILDAWWDGESLCSVFEVQNSLLLVTYTWRKDSILFDITVVNTRMQHDSGGKKMNGEEIPKVTVFPVGTRQKAVLKRK